MWSSCFEENCTYVKLLLSIWIKFFINFLHILRKRRFYAFMNNELFISCPIYAQVIAWKIHSWGSCSFGKCVWMLVLVLEMFCFDWNEMFNDCFIHYFSNLSRNSYPTKNRIDFYLICRDFDGLLHWKRRAIPYTTDSFCRSVRPQSGGFWHVLLNIFFVRDKIIAVVPTWMPKRSSSFNS